MIKTSTRVIIMLLAVVIITSISALTVFAATNFPLENYSLSAGSTSGPILYYADENYMYFNTRPTYGTEGVYLQVSGAGVNVNGEQFPYYTSRPPLKISTSKYSFYTAYLSAGNTSVGGKLNVYTRST